MVFRRGCKALPGDRDDVRSRLGDPDVLRVREVVEEEMRICPESRRMIEIAQEAGRYRPGRAGVSEVRRREPRR
jgi:hypothetical protein